MICNFGNNLKRLRLEKNYTQEQATQLLNISAKSLSRWECGSTMPDVMMLPEIARLYGVTVDDLYKEKSIAYENYASRLFSIYESSHDINDFVNAEREYAKLLKSNNYTMNDLCSYAILYQFYMMDCKKMALNLFQKGLDMSVDKDPITYHQMERQRMIMLSQIGENERNIKEQTDILRKNPNDFYSHLNLLLAYLYANENQKALDVFIESEKKFDNQAILFSYGGDLYHRLGMYENAFVCWNKTLSLDTDNIGAMWSKAECYEELGDYPSAYQVWLEIMDWMKEKGYDIEVEEPQKRAKNCYDKINNNPICTQ